MGRSDRPSRKGLGKASMSGSLLRLAQFGAVRAHRRGGELGIVACERARFDARASLARCALAMTLILVTLGVGASAASALAFPTVKLLDSFERTSEEKPPSRGGETGEPGEWREPGWFTPGGRFEASKGGYAAGAVATDEYGAYWHPVEYESPAVRVMLAKAPASGGKFGLWACISAPEPGVSNGYRVEFSVTTTEHYTVTIFRYESSGPEKEKELAKTEGVILKEKEYIGLTVHSGRVKAWIGETVALEASDTKYTKGYVAFFGSGTGQRLKDFEAAAVPPTVTKVETTSGPSGGGTLVTIKGTGFVSPAKVTIGTEATEVTVHSETEITAKTSAAPAGTDAVIVKDENGTSEAGPAEYTFIAPPTVLAGAASAVTQSSATLNATVNPNNAEVTPCTFEYGTSEPYVTSIACSPLPGSGTSPVGVSASIASLEANTTYHFRISASSPGGPSESVGAFQTLPNPPTIATESATAVTQTTATLNASVNPNGGNVTECTFDYGATIAYGSSVPCSALPGSGSSSVAVSGSVTSLLANTTYHFRIVATNAGGSSEGADQTLTTPPTPITPTTRPITPLPTPTPGPAPATNSSFALPASAVVNRKTGATTFHVSLDTPGTFSWLLTFKNGKFGLFSVSSRKCTKGNLKLGGKCRPAEIVFGKGSLRVAAAGVVTFTVKPSGSASKALKNAIKQKKELPVKLTLTFQSARGGSPVSHSGTLTVN